MAHALEYLAVGLAVAASALYVARALKRSSKPSAGGERCPSCAASCRQGEK